MRMLINMLFKLRSRRLLRQAFGKRDHNVYGLLIDRLFSIEDREAAFEWLDRYFNSEFEVRPSYQSALLPLSVEAFKGYIDHVVSNDIQRASSISFDQAVSQKLITDSDLTTWFTSRLLKCEAREDRDVSERRMRFLSVHGYSIMRKCLTFQSLTGLMISGSIPVDGSIQILRNENNYSWIEYLLLAGAGGDLRAYCEKWRAISLFVVSQLKLQLAKLESVCDGGNRDCDVSIPQLADIIIKEYYWFEVHHKDGINIENLKFPFRIESMYKEGWIWNQLGRRIEMFSNMDQMPPADELLDFTRGTVLVADGKNVLSKLVICKDDMGRCIFRRVTCIDP